MSLPSGYTQLKYIQSSGTQYIDTAFFPSGNALRVVMKFQYTAAHSSMSLFGNHTSTPYSLTVYGARPTFWVGETNDLSCGPETELNTDYTLDAKVDGGTLTAVWNGTTYTAAYSGSLYTEQSVFIFGGNSNGALAEAGSGYRLYSFQLYDDGMLKRDFVPAKNSSGTIGLYDLANNTFYTNAGTGTFTAGPVAAGPVDGDGVTIIDAVSFGITAGKTLVNGTAYDIKQGKAFVGGTAYKICVMDDPIPVTITGSGNSSACYATINGTKHYTATSGIEVMPGDTIQFYATGTGSSFGTALVKIDGTTVASGKPASYTWTVPECNAIAIKYEKETTWGMTKYTITVTTT